MAHHPSRTRRNRRSAEVFGLAALCAAAACSDGEAARSGGPPAAVVVEVVELRPELLRDEVELLGQLDAELSVQVRPDTSGIVESIEFLEGQAVKKGDVLFRLNGDQPRAWLREAEAERELKRTVYDRTKRLTKQDILSEAQLDRAAAELARETARVEASRAALEKTIIRAPFDGVVGAHLISPGARVEPDDVLTQIDAIDRLQAVFTLPESVLGVARPGMSFAVRVAPFPDERFAGEIHFVAPTVDPQTRRVLVKGWVPNPGHRLRPGLFANLRAEIGRRDDALLVPESALALDRAGTFVWRLGPGDVAERVPVETGLRVDRRVEITRGLRPGDRVVGAGTNKVHEGSVLRAAAPAGGAEPKPEAAGARPAGDGS
jgi:membrane fusion protein (multidrug efflux system)